MDFGFFGPLGGGVLGKCQESQESSCSYILKCHPTTFSFRMLQTRNYNVVKGGIMDHMKLQLWEFSLLIYIIKFAI